MNWIERYELSVYRGNHDGFTILHSPLARKEVEIPTITYLSIKDLNDPPEEFKCLVDYTPFDERSAVKTPEDYTLLTVLPNNKCNFQCSYCYSAGYRNAQEIQPKVLHNAIDFFIDSKRDRPSRHNLTISFMGGGEPMLSWPIVQDAVKYAESRAIHSGININFRVITNGSLLTEDELNFFLQHNIGVSVSFEVLERIQNIQRKHYDLVSNNIRTLLDGGVNVHLNITITKANVETMEETLDQIIAHYPEIKNAMFEPVTDPSSFKNAKDLFEFLTRYTEGFFKIKETGRKHGIDITSFPYLRTIFPLKRACPGELCITAEGYLTGCYCVSTQDHPLFHRTHYGHVDAEGLKYDFSRYNSLLHEDVTAKKECAGCTARWNCGGGCFHSFNTHPEEMRSMLCEFTRKFVEECVRYKIRQHECNRNTD